MDKRQPNQKQKAEKPKASKSSQPHKVVLRPKAGSPMEKFNSALRKILLVPKKNIKEK